MRTAARACLVALLGALAGAACAGGEAPSGDPRGFGGSDAPGQGRDGGYGRLNVFISPSGEPFHGDRDGAYASAAWFARADVDHDGKLTLTEFQSDALRAFMIYDTNGDGLVDAFEIQHYEQVTAPEILPTIDGLRAGEGMDGSLFKSRGAGRREVGQNTRSRRQIATDRESQGGSLYGMLAEPEPLTAADADLSGSITRAEWLVRTDRRFALLDVSGQGYLTLSMLPQPRAQILLERRRVRDADAARRGAAHH